jgi:CheY-like chemotaxis protein
MAHLLLIDDDPTLIRGQVCQAFPAPPHRVEVATSGAEGLERVAARHPGIQGLERVAARHPDVILLGCPEARLAASP